MRKTDWGLVKARPLIDEIPVYATDNYDKSNDLSEGMVNKIWSKIWVDNLTENVKFVGDLSEYGLYNLCDKWKGMTAYLVGAGPSLKDNVHDIPKTGKIITNTHSLKFLLKNGVKPDYVGLVDAFDRQAEWCDIGNDSKDLTLLMDINCTPKIFKVWKGQIVFFRTVNKPDEGATGTAKKLWELSDMEHFVGSGGNVMTAMLGCAHLMGFQRFVFVGHDYANTGGNFERKVDYPDSQDKGETSAMPEDMKFNDAMIDIDIQGLGILTLARMWLYKYWTESLAFGCKDREFINATEGGILGSYPGGNLGFIRQMRLVEV